MKRTHTLVAWLIERREKKVVRSEKAEHNFTIKLVSPGIWRAYCQYDTRASMRRVLKGLRARHGKKWDYRWKRIELKEKCSS